MKTLTINDRADVRMPDFLREMLKEKGVRAFNLFIDGKETRVSLQVNLEKVTSAFKDGTPEAFEGVTNITVVI